MLLMSCYVGPDNAGPDNTRKLAHLHAHLPSLCLHTDQLLRQSAVGQLQVLHNKQQVQTCCQITLITVVKSIDATLTYAQAI